MAALTNLFGEYASDEEGEASGDVQGALPDAARLISDVTAEYIETQRTDANTGVVLLGGAAAVHTVVAAAPPGLLPERPSADAVDEEPMRFPWAEPDTMATASGAVAVGAGERGAAEGPEAPQDAADDVVMDEGDGAAEQLRLPPELSRAPPGPVDPALQAKVEKLWQAKLRTGKNITQEVNSMRPYRNPDFLQKMVDFFGIDHTGTCFAPDIWDPKSLPAEDFYDRLAAEFEEKRKQERSDQGKSGRLEFVRPASGPDLTRLPTGGDLAAQLAANAKAAASAKATSAAAGGSRRTSKWDAGKK